MSRRHDGAAPGAAVEEVLEFLPCRTPDAWFHQAADNVALLLVDHANCEKKAAGTALSLLYRYVDRPELLHRLSRLAREELRHFEQVHELMLAHGVAYRHISPSRYAATLMGHVRREEPWRLVDTLLVGAVVEARSCERFHGLVDVLPETLAGLYRNLLASEARHFIHYLGLARRYAPAPVAAKLEELLAADAWLCAAPDVAFRFHSGVVQP
ncbi:MAG: tRNA-(ms[2]io[6]A)-hydroxylase [Pseudomonadota bacterium]